MEDKRTRNKFHNTYNQELRFTKEDRNEVFEQIHKLKMNNITHKKSQVFSSKNFVPITVSFLAVGLCLFFFIPFLINGKVINENNKNNTSEVASQEDEYSTTLFTVKDENNRIPLNLLLTYSKDKKMMKVLSIPRDTYAPIYDKNAATTSYDKLTFAYGSGGAENVRTTVSRLFELPIDYYAVMDLKTFSTLIDSVNGIDYELQEDIRVSALSQVAFEFKKGTNHLNGEEIVALMMAASNERGSGLSEENLLNLILAVMNKIKSEVPQTQLKELTTDIESNISINHMLNNMEINSVKSLSLSDGIINEMIDSKFFITFKREILHSVLEELTTFN